MPQAQDEAGNIWEIDAQGNPIALVSAANQPPADPEYPYVAPKAEAEARREQIGVQGDQVSIANTQDTIEDRRADNARDDTKLIADLYTKGLRPDGRGGVERIPDWQPAKENKPIEPMKLAQFRALESQIARVEELYAQGPGSTSGVMGIRDYLPSDTNAAFNSASAGLGEVGMAAFRIPGIGTQSDNDLRQFVAANTPSASDRDAAIREKLGNLKRRLAATKAEINLPEQGEQISAFDVNRIISGGGPGAASAGATTQTTPIPPEMQAENQAFLQQWAGNPDPQAYVQFRQQLDQKYGFEGDPAEYNAWATKTAQQLGQGGYTLNPDIPGVTEELTGTDKARNDLVNNPVGAGVANYMDAVGFGGVSAFAGDQMDALQDSQPVSSMIGQVGGAITATNAIGRAGGAIAGKVAPNLLQGGSKAQFGRNLATDAAYGAGYGQVADGDALTGAAFGAAGSAGGQILGKGAGNIIGGVDLAPAVKALKARGVPLTTGQTLGGMVGRIEDKATSMPIIGDMIRNRRLEGFEKFNQEAFTEAGAPIGASTRNTGEQGVRDLLDQAGTAYDDATAGVNVQFDDQFRNEITSMDRFGEKLPPDARPAFDKVGANYVLPITEAGSMSGDIYQKATRALKAKRNKPPTGAQGFEQEWKEGITAQTDALTGLMTRQGGDGVVKALSNADEAYKRTKTLEDAARRAAGGSQTDEIFQFTPSQLQRAGLATQKKFPGERPFQELADSGQQVLPSSVPNSGTADRAAQMLVPGGVGAGAGAGYLADGQDGIDEGAKIGAAMSLILALGGTRGGQNAINKALTGRPEQVRKLGEIVKKRRGMFGTAGGVMAREQ